MSTPRFWNRVTYFNLAPSLSFGVEAVNIIYINFISSTKYVENAFIHYSCGMSPSCWWHILGYLNFCTDYTVWAIPEKTVQLKNVKVIHVYILWMTATKGDDLSSVDCAGRMKSFRREAILAIYLRLVPYFFIKIKGPEIIKINAVSFSSNDNHQILYQRWCMIGPPRRNKNSMLFSVDILWDKNLPFLNNSIFLKALPVRRKCLWRWKSLTAYLCQLTAIHKILICWLNKW